MKVIINKFDGAMVNDPRDPRENVSRVLTNFDILTDPYRMIPYRDSEDGSTNQSNIKIQNFAVGKLNGTPTYALFGLGVTSGNAKAEVYYKNLSTGGSNDLGDDGWAETTGNKDTTGTTGAFDLFIFYEKTGLFYGARDGSHIWTYDAVNTTFAASSKALTYTNVAQGIVHSKDDILYVPYYYNGGGVGASAVSAIASKDGAGGWNTGALNLPKHLRIRSIAEFGNYIAVACEPVSGATPGFGGSIVYLWNRDSTLTTLSDSIYWGEERLLIIEEINGNLIGISIATGATRFTKRIIFRNLSVSSGIKFAEFTTSNPSIGTDLLSFKRKINNRLYFLMEIEIDGVARDGVWSVGGRPGEFNIIHERTTSNDDTFTDLELFGFHAIGDYIFISHADSAVHAMVKTNNTASYTASSIYESQINPKMIEGDRGKNKQLTAIRVTYEPLPSAGQVVLKYKVDGGSYITVFTETTDGVLFTERVKDATPDEFTSGREYEFRIESTGNAVITGLEYKYDVLDTLI